MTSSEQPEALVGAVLNRTHRIHAVLGEGGLATVYRAEPLDGSAPVAVKILKPEFRGDPDVVGRFLAEASAAALIDHPGVVRILGAQRAEDGTPYLVTELLTGHTLSVPMNRGPLPIEQSVHVALDLLEMLASAHRAGVVHRDLKPDNVFLEPAANGSVRVRLLDFGISRVVEAAGGSARKTKTGVLLGTPGYMSPEQVLNSKQVDHRSDLYSAAVLFYELISGERAFDGQTGYERMMAVLFSDARPIEHTAPQFAHWSEFFSKALARGADDRFQSAVEMRDALAAVAQHGRLPGTRFGGQSTAVSPSALDGAVEKAAPQVPVVSAPWRGPLAHRLVIGVVCAVLGFLLGYGVGVR